MQKITKLQKPFSWIYETTLPNLQNFSRTKKTTDLHYYSQPSLDQRNVNHTMPLLPIFYLIFYAIQPFLGQQSKLQITVSVTLLFLHLQNTTYLSEHANTKRKSHTWIWKTQTKCTHYLHFRVYETTYWSNGTRTLFSAFVTHSTHASPTNFCQSAKQSPYRMLFTLF